MAYSLNTKFTTTPDGREKLESILLAAAQVLENNTDCFYYVISHSEDSQTVYVAEAWTTRRAAEMSLQDEKIKQLVGEAMPLMAGPPEKLSETEIVGGKGIR